MNAFEISNFTFKNSKLFMHNISAKLQYMCYGYVHAWKVHMCMHAHIHIQAFILTCLRILPPTHPLPHMRSQGSKLPHLEEVSNYYKSDTRSHISWTKISATSNLFFHDLKPDRIKRALDLEEGYHFPILIFTTSCVTMGKSVNLPKP